METRTVYVADTKNQKKYTINTNASTLGELKQVLRQNNINYTNMSFTEGNSHTTLEDDNAPLPTNIPYKGNVTNNLVVLLTNTTKNIPSGAIDRKEAYEAIKAKNLQEKVKETYGKNFTQVKTSDLESLINEYSSEPSNPSLVGSVVKEEDWNPESEETSDIEESVNGLFRQLTDEEKTRLLKAKTLFEILQKTLETAIQAVDLMLED